MPLKAVVESLDDLNEDQRAFYVEQDGAYVLDIEDIKVHPATKPLQVALERLKGEASETKTKLTEALAKLEAKPNPTKADEAEMVRLRESLEKERDEAKARAEALEKKVFGLTVESQLETHLREAGITEAAYLRAAKRDLVDLVKIVNDKPVVQTADVGDFSLPEYVKRYVSAEGAAFVSKPQGAGTRGGDNPGKSKSITRADFEALQPEQRMAAIREGVAIAD